MILDTIKQNIKCMAKQLMLRHILNGLIVGEKVEYNDKQYIIK